MDGLVTFAAVGVALHGTHDFADHWIQSNCDAARKGEDGWRGRLHCLSHVASYGATQTATLVALWLLLDLELRPVTLAAGMLVNLATHYFADRRAPLKWLASKWPGKLDFYNLGAGSGTLGTGAYALDQSWHKLWLTISALIIAL